MFSKDFRIFRLFPCIHGRMTDFNGFDHKDLLKALLFNASFLPRYINISCKYASQMFSFQCNFVRCPFVMIILDDLRCIKSCNQTCFSPACQYCSGQVRFKALRFAQYHVSTMAAIAREDTERPSTNVLFWPKLDGPLE